MERWRSRPDYKAPIKKGEKYIHRFNKEVVTIELDDIELFLGVATNAVGFYWRGQSRLTVFYNSQFHESFLPYIESLSEEENLNSPA